MQHYPREEPVMRLKYASLASSVLVIWFLSLLPAQAAGWQLLGERTVRFTTDRDVIRVTASEGTFSKVKLRVLRNGIELLDVKIVYGDGGSQDFQIRRFIAAGSETRVLDLPGVARVIKKVELVYRSSGRTGKRASIQLWGLEAGPATPAEPQPDSPPVSGSWKLLGERSVNHAVDRDVILVTGVEGTFRKIKLKVSRRGIQLLDLKIHFGNGETYDVSVREVIRAGGETRVIDLPGGARVISKVDMIYRSGGPGRGKALVSLWGS
jgi:hypothetical protein